MTLGKQLNKTPEGYKLCRKNTAIKVLHFLLACPFYKAAGQEINVIRGQKVENAVNAISNHTDKITKQLERLQPSLFLKKNTNKRVIFHEVLKLIYYFLKTQLKL